MMAHDLWKIEKPLDDDGYPTEEVLSAINFVAIIEDSEENTRVKEFNELMKFIKTIWKLGKTSYIEYKDDVWYLSTGGWEGNEDIIESMMNNPSIWSIFWESSTRGGHFTFRSSYGKSI